MVVAAWSGGVASSSTTVRTWERQGTTLHHIVDPSTGWPADPEWRLVTVAARTCVEANTAATAAVVWGEDALFEIAQRGLAARFVRRDGEVIEVGGWPSPESESDQESGAR
jgi:thiamine biosynthesis lipoprotein